MQLQLPSQDSPGQLLIWAQSLLLWTISKSIGRKNWGLPALLIAPAVALILPGANLNSVGVRLIIAFTVGVGGFAVKLVPGDGIRAPKKQSWIAKQNLQAETEIAMACLAVLALGALAAKCVATNELPQSLFSFPVPHKHLAAITFFAAAMVFLTSDATEIVRGWLRKGGIEPSGNSALGYESVPVLQLKNYSAGRLIGSAERILLLAVVVIGKYEALGFLLAAKGLIRSKDLENRDFAEYFILGTLLSMAIALAVGLLLKGLVLPLWD